MFLRAIAVPRSCKTPRGANPQLTAQPGRNYSLPIRSRPASRTAHPPLRRPLPMTDRLAGKTAFITAAGQGIGRATAEAFVREGARVIATDINDELLADLARATRCETRRLDVTDASAVLAASIEANTKSTVDVLFNGAGYVHAGTILECDELA